MVTDKPTRQTNKKGAITAPFCCVLRRSSLQPLLDAALDAGAIEP